MAPRRDTVLGRLVALADGRARHRDDPAVVAELDWAANRGHLDLPVGLEVEWLGTAGFRLTAEGTTILVDPFLTRRSLAGSVRTRALLPDPALVRAHLPATRPVDAILVGHTHFDHAVDVPLLAADHGCPVYGSSSLARLMALHGAPERAVVVVPHARHQIGPFTVSFVPSLHSKLAAGLAVPQSGELTCDHLDHLGLNAYRCGAVRGIRIEVDGTVLYHQGSANLIDDEVPTGVDIFLAGIAGRLYTPRYAERILGRMRPRVVVAHHWDDFFRPLDSPTGFSLNVNVGGFVEEVAEVDRDIAVRVMAPLRPVAGGR